MLEHLESTVNITDRLNALENRVQQNEEKLLSLNARSKAHSMIFTAIGVPLCAVSPATAAQIITCLLSYEKEARAQNARASLIREFREVRESLEGQIDLK